LCTPLLKEIYQLASLLEHFSTQIVLKRPATHLGGLSYEIVLNRINHALIAEKNELPRIVFDKDTENYKRFTFEWAENSKFRFTGTPEFYYKQEKKLSGQIQGMIYMFKQVMKSTTKLLENEEK